MSRPLFIPALGTEVVLAEDWTFTLHKESRNSGFAEGLDIAERRVQVHAGSYQDNGTTETYRYTTKHTVWPAQAKSWEVTLAAGTVLRMERIYIKQNQGRFDSVTFRDVGRSHRHGRFWVKLADANTAVLED